MRDQILKLGHQIEAALARGDHETAKRCVEEQERIVERMLEGR